MDELAPLIAGAPTCPGIYIFTNRRGAIVYVGKSKSLKNRLKSHLTQSKSANSFKKYDALYSEAAGAYFEPCENETAALIREAALIKAYSPKYNSQLVGNRAYPFVAIDTDAAYPSIIVKKGKPSGSGAAFGSFYSESDALSTIGLLSAVLGTPPCNKTIKKGMKACLHYHMGECSGPCEGKLSKEAYRAQIDKAIAILRGDCAEAIRSAKKEMEAYSRAMEYEKAAEEKEKAYRLSLLAMKARRLDTDIENGSFALFFRAYNEGAFSLFRIEAGQVKASRRFSCASLPGAEDLADAYLQTRGDYPANLAGLLVEIRADKYFVRMSAKPGARLGAKLYKNMHEYLALRAERGEARA